jgi:hypothetical protein
MTAPTEKSSLPLLLGLTGAVLAVVGVGWFYLDNEPAVEPSEPAWTVKEPQVEVIEESLPDAVVSEALTLAAPAETDAATEPETVANINVDADLRKARLAAGADILVFPESESALFYYNRVIESNPNDDVVTAEFSAVLGNIEKTVAAHILAEEFDQAHRIAVIVANRLALATTQQPIKHSGERRRYRAAMRSTSPRCVRPSAIFEMPEPRRRVIASVAINCRRRKRVSRG